jgi:O-antigen ligase
MLLLARAWLADSAASRRRWLLGGAVLLLAVAAATQIDLVRERLQAEREVVAQIRAGEWDAIGYSPIGIRVHLFTYGVDRWLERPWLGWGPGALPALLDILPDARLHQQDLHNLYLDMLVRVGLLGSLPLAIGLLLVLRSAARMVRQRRVPTDLALVLLGGIGLHLILALSNMRGLNVDWRHVWMLFAGALASFALFAPGPGGDPIRAPGAPPSGTGLEDRG